jgi:hypothetical protein
MLIFDNNNKPIILDSVHTPIIAEYMWVLDLNLMDFTLVPLIILEEILSPTIEIMILGFRFSLPATWNILIVDEETSQLDVVEVSNLAGKEFQALIYGPTCGKPENHTVTVTNYFPTAINVGASLNKHQMLCHPISPNLWINVAPTDTYNKYFKNMVIGDLI